MANYPTQWQIVENDIVNYYCYVSKWGNDSTGDGSANNPYKTINAGVTYLNAYNGSLTRILVIGTGQYINESISVSRNAGNPIIFYGEGQVIFDGSQSNYITLTIPGDSLENIKCTGYSTRSILSIQGEGMNSYVKNCYIDGGYLYLCYENYAYGAAKLYNSIFLNCYMGNLGWSGNEKILTIVNCYFYNCRITGLYGYGYPYTISDMYNNIFDSCLLTLNTLNLTGTFDFNNFINTALYMNQESTPRDLTWLQNNTTTNKNSISANPLFNDESNENYTLQSSSPCLRTGKKAANIGPFGRGFYYTAQTLWDNRDTNYCFNIQYVNGLCLVNSGEKTGRLKTKYFDLGAKVKISNTNILAVMQYLTDGTPTKIVDYECGDYSLYDNSGQTVYFDGDTCSYNPGSGLAYYRCNITAITGTSGAFNPTYWDVISGTREKSMHYDFKLRYSQTSTDLDTYGTTVHLLSNGACIVDANGVGNASPDFNISGPTYNIIMRYFDLDIKLKDTSSS